MSGDARGIAKLLKLFMSINVSVCQGGDQGVRHRSTTTTFVESLEIALQPLQPVRCVPPSALAVPKAGAVTSPHQVYACAPT